MKADTPQDVKKESLEEAKASDHDVTLPRSHSGSDCFYPGDIVAERYRIEAIIGQGGMGTVYSATQIFLKRRYALKTLTSVLSTGSAGQRFQREARSISKLEHPNIIRIHDFGVLDGQRPFFAMDLLQGGTLADWLERGPLSVEQAYDIFLQICAGLGYAHSMGVVHRDIKPGNIALSPDESHLGEVQVKILDFGIAKQLEEETQKLTRTGELFGTPLYMSPEQCRGLAADHRADIYSFGCVFFEALTGAPPFAAESALATMMLHLSEQPPTLKEGSLGQQFPDSLEMIVARLLSKEPSKRYQTLDEVARDLRAARAGERIKSAHEDLEKERPMGWQAFVRNPLVLMTALLVISAGLLANTYAMLEYQRRSEQLVKLTLPQAPPILPVRKRSESRGFYSHVEGRDIVFDFPTDDPPIGEIFVTDKRLQPARGKIRYAIGYEISFQPSSAFCQQPAQFLRFRPDDLYRIRFTDDSDVVDGTLAFIEKLKGLRALRISDTDISDEGLRFIDDLPHLRDLDVSRTKCTGSGILRLKHLDKMEVLCTDALPDVSKMIVGMQNCSKLIHLAVSNCNLTNDDLKLIGNIHSLRSLRMVGNRAVTDAGLAYLTELPLDKLQIFGCSVTPGCIKYLAQMKQLKYLKISTINWSATEEAKLRKALPAGCMLEGASRILKESMYSY